MEKIKNIRLYAALSIGALITVLSLTWLLLIDLKIKVSSLWLIEVVLFSLIPGLLIIATGLSATDDTKIKSIIFNILAIVLIIPFFIFTLLLSKEESIQVNIIKFMPNFQNVVTLFIVLFSILTVLMIALLSLNIYLKFKENDEEERNLKELNKAKNEE
ncbi:MAG: hypothetical protein MR270_04475 [Erysipelotrichaceae bacterium]|nr:hypothetical protein [Erysipelotrichaceae bacterium]